MSAVQEFNVEGAVYFDGETPIPQPVLHLRLSDGTLRIHLEDDRVIAWPEADIRTIRDHAGAYDETLRLKTDPLARLYVESPILLHTLSRPYRAAPPKGRLRLASWAVAAIGAVALQIAVLIPLLADGLAELIPEGGERALGAATFEQIRSALTQTGVDLVPVCAAPDGVAALDAMETKLVETLPTPPGLSVFVLDHEMVNAFALPGGYVVLFRGLIEEAETPDEVAAVFAHEIGHVVSRDPTRHALRSAGSIGILGLLFGDFAGGAMVLFLANQLINAQYSQSAEADADSFATDMLLRANVSPAALGSFFERLRDEHGDSEGLVAHFQSHPELGDRIEAARMAAPGDVAFVPSLTDAEWTALREICKTTTSEGA